MCWCVPYFGSSISEHELYMIDLAVSLPDGDVHSLDGDRHGQLEWCILSLANHWFTQSKEHFAHCKFCSGNNILQCLQQAAGCKAYSLDLTAIWRLIIKLHLELSSCPAAVL